MLDQLLLFILASVCFAIWQKDIYAGMFGFFILCFIGDVVVGCFNLLKGFYEHKR